MSNPEHTTNTANTSNTAGPTPPVDPRIATALPSERRSRRTRVLIAGGLAAAVGIVSIGGQLVATPQASATAPHRAVQSDDAALGELAEELKDLGVHLESARSGGLDADGSDDWADDSWGTEDWADDTEGDDDPFEGYSDAEIDAMSDEEFFGILDGFADSDSEDSDSEDSDFEDSDFEDSDFEDSDSNDTDEFGDDDPFEGYTDAEIDAMSDEEFFAILDAFDGGEDWGDENWGDEDWSDEDGEDEDGHDDHDHEAGQEEVLGTFSVNGDSIDLSNASPEVAAQATEIWERFVQLIPADQRQMLTAFELNPAEASGAYVYPNDDPSTWSMGVSLGLDEDLDYVLIHEFAHLLTLQAKEVPPGADTNPDACPTYFTGEGCALSGTTMATFVERFWPAPQLEEIARLQEAEDYDGLEAFYDNNSDDFVTDYATTNPAEDLAETFTVFVLNDRPTGNTIADQKVNLLWEDAGMVALRDQIRANR